MIERELERLRADRAVGGVDAEPREPTSAAFGELLHLRGAARRDRLAAIAEDDPALAAELTDLLARAQRIAQAVDRPVFDAPDESPVAHPSTVGRYRLVREIGRGGSGVVWLAEQDRPRREVVVKLLRWDHRGPEDAARLLREADLLARLDHPCCARVLEAGLLERPGADPVPWIAMPYYAGVPLSRATRGWPWQRTLALFEALSAGVHAAHQAGVVHRDLKPENVLVDADDRPLVLDFGIARLLDGDSQTGGPLTEHVLGTPAYMAPEQARGERDRIDARTDVYALATMLYEALTGELPLDTRGAGLTQALRRIAEHDPVPLRERAPHLPRDLGVVLEQALACDPSRRHPSARAFAADLAAVRERRPVSARPPSLGYQLARFVARHRALAVAVASAFVGLTAGLSAALFALERAREAGRRARANEAQVARLADLRLVDALRRVEDELWPAHPEHVPELERVIAEAEAAERRLAPELERLAADPGAVAESEREALRLAAAFFRPANPLRGLPGLRTRLERAGAVADATLVEPIDAWRAAAERVAADPRFGGFRLGPVLGLVPLGPDPRSGFEEFAHWGWTGDVPVRDSDGELVLGEHSAVVLVLLPGGEHVIGHQRDDPTAPRYAANARPHEAPTKVHLAPYFLAKHEFTHAQWTALGLDDPSYWAPGDVVLGSRIDGGFAVETVSWRDAVRAAQRLGLALPTEAQWEVAAAAGVGGSWWRRPSIAALARWSRSPLAAEWLATASPEAAAAPPPEYAAGVVLPVGSLAPNPYGLHEMYGGVAEWCADTFWVWPERVGPREPGTARVRHRDAAREATNAHRSVRGTGNWRSSDVFTPGLRDDCVHATAYRDLGFRVAYTVER